MPDHPVHRDPSDAWARHMRRGRFEAAWAVCDAALRARAATAAAATCWHLPRHLQAVWAGQPLAGRRVLVHCYHGLGDTIQFIRYAPLLRAVAAEVAVWAQPPLIPLLRTAAAGIDRLSALHDGAPDATTFDVGVEVMELPHVFRTTPQTIPATVPYLHVGPGPAPPPRDGRRLAAGIVWRAGDWDDRRSIPFAALAPLADLPGVRWHVLQQRPERAGWQQGFGSLAGSDDLLELARILRGLDLLVSVDSMPAHLAGALGVPVWNLLHAHADWRWMEERDDSPWYPTMRLFRQPRPGDWSGAIARVASELKSHRPPPRPHSAPGNPG